MREDGRGKGQRAQCPDKEKGAETGETRGSVTGPLSSSSSNYHICKDTGNVVTHKSSQWYASQKMLV